MNPMYRALGGSQPSAVTQPSAPPLAGSPASGGGSIYDALRGSQPMPSFNAPLPLGQQIADARGISSEQASLLGGNKSPQVMPTGEAMDNGNYDATLAKIQAQDAENRRLHPEQYR